MKNKKTLSVRTLVVISSVLALLLCAAGLTIAYIIDKTDPVTNTFTPSKVSCQVVETNWQDGNVVKENVTVANTGDTAAYIRSAIVVTWQNDRGEVYSQAPVLGTDYSMDLNLNAGGWVLGADGYYYHTSPVAVESSTQTLINSCSVLAPAPAEGYTLSVEILASAVQSEPATAAEDAWGVTVDDESNALAPAVQG